MKGSGHEGIIFRGIGKDHKFGTANPISISSQFCSFFDDIAHQANSIHINSGSCGSNIY